MQARKTSIPVFNRNVQTWFREGIDTFVSANNGIVYPMLANPRTLQSPDDLIGTFTGGSYYSLHGVFEPARMYEPGRGWTMGFDPLIFRSAFRVPDEMTQYRGNIASMVQNWARNLGANAIQTIDLLWVNLLNNGFNAAYPIYDTLPLFSTAHPLRNAPGVFANRPVSGAALDENTLAAGLTYFMNIADDDGMSMAMTPKYLLVPTTMHLLAEQLVGSQSPLAAPNENVRSRVYQKLQVISSPKLTSATAWFILAEPSELQSQGHGLDLWFSPNGMPKTRTLRNEDPQYTKYIGELQTVAYATKARGVYGNPGV